MARNARPTAAKREREKALIERRQQKIAKERGFAISEHALYLYADCTKPRCPYRKAGGSG